MAVIMKRSSQHGLTLIQLMIVIAIAGVLAAIALPAYQNHAKRSRIAEVVQAASACRDAVAAAYQAGAGTAAPDWGCAARAPAHPRLSGFTISDDGAITLTVGGWGDRAVDGKQLMLTPMHADGIPKDTATPGHLGAPVAKWGCGPTAGAQGLPPQFVPDNCRG